MRKFDIFMIGGSGRSGTTILAKIMSLHPAIADVPELRYLIDPDGIVDFYTTSQQWSPYHYNKRLNRLETILRDVEKNCFSDKLAAYATYVFRKLPWKLRKRYWGVSVENYCPDFHKNVDELLSHLITITFKGEWIGMGAMNPKVMRYGPPPQKIMLAQVLGDFLRKIFSQIVEKQNVRCYLEKNTWNHIWFDSIQEILPESKLVHISRDPRDVVSSYCSQSWMPVDPVQSALILKDLLLRWEEVKCKISKESFFDISLEGLVSRPEKTLRKVCEFYGIEWSNNLLEIDLSFANRGRWKKHFTNEQSYKVHEILNDFIERHEDE